MKDTIYRQEALEGLYDVFFDDELSAAYPKEADKVLDVIRKLPSAQPEQQMKCGGCRYDNHASGWSEHCVLCRRNYLNFKDRYERRT